MLSKHQQKKGEFFGSFCRFFLEKKGRHTSGLYLKRFEHSLDKTNLLFEFLSEKDPISKKKLAETESRK
jgi:hypothetical protein